MTDDQVRAARAVLRASAQWPLHGLIRTLFFSELHRPIKTVAKARSPETASNSAPPIAIRMRGAVYDLFGDSDTLIGQR